ncbi:hypothetical protein DPSP01_011588 [Paraphaeosphaeria sporulosa]|uniref:Zn(2)-C6 fungal-type domain-containing protein n=1 Tax=Paraphaeosphaeria sporulosa TaxID=1460663 RepID=A0A177CXR3_9PLEO|nr:uncharacterized protein CC84DRAFT_101156 [Paraphaeosphaeria sporulosa]OAG12323.1 hypothetical protein CC84DRAFT_101156 [Paraphaeosphaeria sporulosa]
MESNLDNLDLYAFDQPFDPNRPSFNYNLSHQTWPLPPAQMPQQHDGTHQQQQHQHDQRRVNTVATTQAHSPNGLPHTSGAIAPHQLQTTGLTFPSAMATNPMLAEWINLSASTGFAQQAFGTDLSSLGGDYGAFGAGPLQTSPVDFPINTSQALMTSMSMNAPSAFGMMATTSMDMTQQMAPFGMADFAQDFSNISNGQEFSVSSAVSASAGSGSPTEQWLEVRSLSSSDNGWNTVDFGHRNSYDFSSDPTALIINPAQTLHIRTNSDSSNQSDAPPSAHSFSSYDEIHYPMHSPQSEAENQLDLTHSPHSHSHSSSCHHGLPNLDQEYSNYISPNQSVSPPMPRAEPVDIKQSASSSSSPTSSAVSSPPTRRRKSPVTTPIGSKPAKTIAKKTPPAHTTKKDASGEKRVGRRRGPLRPEQRQQAHEIRKLRACLRCKFLKKTCDKGDPCGGCQPSHARLWQVPCTRIDIKDIAYFMKDWKADYERHVSLGFSIGNIKGFSPQERPIYITHGYGHYLPIMAREVYVRDEKCFGVDWFESLNGLHFEINTAKLSAGMEGISRSMLSDYLDRHIDGGFEPFIDEYFEGTYFVTEILKTAYRFYCREKLPVIRKALKLVVAYNLTLHVTMVEGLGGEEVNIGKVEDNQSKFHGKTVAPVMINFQVKCALADMWRELQKDVLEELSALYSSVYSGDKLKNWPTIFMLAAIILAVWELIQFDCNYRVPDQPAVQKFCNDMESTPVGVIVGLFSAISQKLPAFSEWDTRKHHNLLNSNPAVCDAMTEVRAHVTKYDTYLRSRSECKFDRNDFDSLSNKFLSKLVIRAN